MLAWMGYAVLAAGALGVAASLLDYAGTGGCSRRRVVWAGVFLASVIGPLAFSLSRSVPTAVAAEVDVRAAETARGWREAPIVSDRMLGSAWLAASAVIALWLMVNQRRLRRRLRRYPARIVDGERVLVSPDFGPAVVGVVRPQIVLPEWALAISESERRIIVAHETEHRHAHDPLLAAAALIAVAALPWNAALWWQLRRLRLAIEIDCDQRVVSRHGYDPHAYGMLLLAARERASRVAPAPAMAMAAMRSGLGRRIEALLDGRPRSVVRRLSAVATAVVLAGMMVSVPAPRLSIARAAVVDPSAVAPPMLQRPALASVQLDTSRTPEVGPVTPPAVAPPREAATERSVRRDEGSEDAVSTAEGHLVTPPVSERWIRLPDGGLERRIVRPRGAPERRVLSDGPLEGSGVPPASVLRMIERSGATPHRRVLPHPDTLRPLPL